MLILASQRKRKRARHYRAAQSGYVVEAFAIRPAIVVDDSLGEMISVAQRRAGNSSYPGIYRIQSRILIRRTLTAASLVTQFSAKFGVEGVRFAGRCLGNGSLILIAHLLPSLFQQAGAFHPRPRTNSQISGLHIPERRQPFERRIHPTV